MDIQHFISTPESFGLDYQDSNLQNIPSNLYNDDNMDVDSQPPMLTPEEILHQMLHTQNITDLPVSSLVSQAVDEYNLPQKMVAEFVKKVKKTKNILKRSRAKARVILAPERIVVPDRKYIISEQSSTDKDTVPMDKQIKKQRNRISAQISRDRKKNYVANLENKNKELASESESLKLENQRLRKQISERYRREKQMKSKNSSRFMRLLVLLGIVFLFYILKDVLNFKGKKNPINLFSAQPNEEIQEIIMLGERKDIVEEIADQLKEMEEQQIPSSISAEKSIWNTRQLVQKKVGEMTKKIKQAIAPDRMWVNLDAAKHLVGL